MSRTLDDVYREVLWRTNLSVSDFPYIYAGGGNYGFLQTFADQYMYLVNQFVVAETDYFLTRSNDSLVANQEVYYLPADLIRLRHIEFTYDNANWFPGTETDPTVFLRGSEQSLVSAATSFHPYFWLGDSITAPSSPYHIAPRPATAVTNGILLYYDQMPSGLIGGNHVSAQLSAASARIIFPSQFEYLLPLAVSVEVWGKFGIREQKADEIARYQKGLEDIRNLMKPRSAVGQKRVRDFREMNVRDS